MSQFGALLLGINPFLTFLVCVPTRILMGWLTGLIYHGLRKTKIPSAASVTIASLCCPLLNTTFFMGTLVTLFASTMRESFGMGKLRGMSKQSKGRKRNCQRANEQSF